MSPYKLALFDFDGTLMDSQDSILFCFKKTFESFGQPAPDSSAIRDTIGMSLLSAFNLLRGNGGPPEGSVWVEKYREILRAEGLYKCKPYPGVEGLLQHLAQQNIACAVVSHRKAEFLNILLQNFALQDYVSLVVGGDPESYLKPDPLVYEKLVKPHFNGISRSQVLMVGDTVFDLEFARNVGVRSCWASYGYGNSEACLAQEPDYQAASVADILSLFQ